MPEKIYLDLDNETVRRLDEDYGGSLEAALADRLPSNRISFALIATSIFSMLAVVVLSVAFFIDHNQAKQKIISLQKQSEGQYFHATNLRKEVEGLRSQLFVKIDNTVNSNEYMEDSLTVPSYWNTVHNHATGGTRFHRLLNNANVSPSLIDKAIRQGADLNIQRYKATSEGWVRGDLSGLTPMMLLLNQANLQSCERRWRMVDHIIRNHIDLIDKDVQNWNGWTCADYAKKANRDNFYTVLKSE